MPTLCNTASVEFLAHFMSGVERPEWQWETLRSRVQSHAVPKVHDECFAFLQRGLSNRERRYEVVRSYVGTQRHRTHVYVWSLFPVQIFPNIDRTRALIPLAPRMKALSYITALTFHSLFSLLQNIVLLESWSHERTRRGAGICFAATAAAAAKSWGSTGECKGLGYLAAQGRQQRRWWRHSQGREWQRCRGGRGIVADVAPDGNDSSRRDRSVRICNHGRQQRSTGLQVGLHWGGRYLGSRAGRVAGSLQAERQQRRIRDCHLRRR